MNELDILKEWLGDDPAFLTATTPDDAFREIEIQEANSKSD